MKKKKSDFEKQLSELEKSDNKTIKTSLSKEKLKQNIEKLEKGIKSGAVPENLLPEMKKKKSDFEKQLSELEEITKKTDKPKKTYKDFKKGDKVEFIKQPKTKLPTVKKAEPTKPKEEIKTASILSRVIGDKTKAKLNVTGDIENSKKLLELVQKELEEEGYTTEMIVRARATDNGKTKAKREKVKYLDKDEKLVKNTLYKKTDSALVTMLSNVTNSDKEEKEYEKEIDIATVIGKSIYVLLAEVQDLVQSKRINALESLASLLANLVKTAYKNDGDDKKLQNKELRRLVNEII